MTNRKAKLLRFLECVFAIGEITVGLGLIAIVPMVQYSATVVERHRGNLGIYAYGGSPSWSWFSSLPFSSEGTLGFNQRTPPTSYHEFGDITFGPFGFKTNEDGNAYRLVPSKITAEAVEINNLEGTVTFKRPGNAVDVLATIKWPFVVSMFCTGGMSILIMELIRRLLSKLRLGQVFTSQSIRTVHLIGSLFIASSLLKLITTGWLKYRMAAYVIQHVAAGSVHLDSTTSGDWSGITIGLVILACAEVFRQGLLLREENALTI
jgi:hypothetical protein